MQKKKLGSMHFSSHPGSLIPSLKVGNSRLFATDVFLVGTRENEWHDRPLSATMGSREGNIMA